MERNVIPVKFIATENRLQFSTLALQKPYNLVSCRNSVSVNKSNLFRFLEIDVTFTSRSFLSTQSEAFISFRYGELVFREIRVILGTIWRIFFFVHSTELDKRKEETFVREMLCTEMT